MSPPMWTWEDSFGLFVPKIVGRAVGILITSVVNGPRLQYRILYDSGTQAGTVRLQTVPLLGTR